MRAIPEGYVRTFGDIEPAAPRLVGHVLATEHDLPWQRVVRADGTLPQGNRNATSYSSKASRCAATASTSTGPACRPDSESADAGLINTKEGSCPPHSPT